MDKILVVDDEKINLMMVKKILGDTYEIETADSGEEAITIVKNFVPTIILMDIHMSGIDGYDTIMKIKQVPGREDIPFIFLTADDDSDAEVKGFELGADDFIRKPFVSAVVKRRVERSIQNYRLNSNLQSEVKKQTEQAERRRQELEVLSIEIIETLATAIDAKDLYTKGHSARVADYSAILAERLGWSKNRIEELRYKALLHDVGKIGVPDRVLNKNGRLTDEEYEVIKSHTTLGSDLLSGVSSLADMYLVARHHHERYDGHGYPDKLSGNKIPVDARIVGIADAYDAMSSDRVYRKALPKDVIRGELINGKGTQFDPDMLEVFVELFDEGKLDTNKLETETGVEQNISDVISEILDSHDKNGAIKLNNSEMSKLFSYINNVHSRYGVDFVSVLISLEWEQNVAREALEQAMKAMEYSIEQSLRKVDVTTRISESQCLLILTGSVVDNIQGIIDRIFAGFYKNCQNVDIKPIYEIK